MNNNDDNTIKPYIKTDNDVKMELNKKKVKSVKSVQNKEDKDKDKDKDEYYITPRYGTDVDLKTNKIINQTDKYTLRDQTIPSVSLDRINRTNYKISRINIDSRNRNTNPKNIVKNYIEVSTPFTFFSNSNILQIEMPLNHGLQVDSTITISNVLPIQIVLRATSLQLKQNLKYLFINHPNHGFIGKNNYINISNVKTSNPNNYFLSNIPISIINGEHNVILSEINGILDYDNYLIDLGIFADNNYIYTEDSFTIDIITLNGINIKYINSSYPISNQIQQGYQTVIEAGTNYIKIALKQYSTKSSVVLEGNSNILIGVINSTINGYADPDYYKYNLKKTYYNVKRIKLVSTEFPNSEMLIKNAPINIKNNALYWKILDDGDYIYNININPGNYDAQSLVTELTTKISKIQRFFGSYLNSSNYNQNCIPSIIINPANNLFSMEIMSIVSLSKCISISVEKYTDSNTRIIITHPYHNLSINDSITIQGATGVLDISSTSSVKYYIPDQIINSTYSIESIEGLNNYVIKLPRYNPIKGVTIDSNIINGGNAINITFPLSISLLFNYSDTIGKILGFNNVGDESSYTIFDKIVTNNTPYNNSSNLNSVGLISYNVPILNFRTYPYIFMASEIFSSKINYKDSVGIFAKLFLTGNPGSMIYDQYIQITDEVPNAFAFLNEIEFNFLTPNGDKYNFNGQDHSYTLEIYELLPKTE
jgi:hypothetical protein